MGRKVGVLVGGVLVVGACAVLGACVTPSPKPLEPMKAGAGAAGTPGAMDAAHKKAAPEAMPAAMPTAMCRATWSGRNAAVVSYTYDAQGRRTGEDHDVGADGSVDFRVRYSLGPQGLPATRTRDEGSAASVYQTVTFGYDAQGREVSQRIEEGGKVRELRTSYGADGHITLIQMVALPGKTPLMRTSFERQGQTYVKSIDFGADNKVDERHITKMDAQGRPVTIDIMVTGETFKRWVKLNYDERGLPTSRDEGRSDRDLPIYREIYLHDAEGRRLETIIDSDGNGVQDTKAVFDYKCP